MSKIDKRQTVEEAAKDYAIGKTFFRKNVLKEVDADDYVLRKDNCREDFKAGAEWLAKQFPWISTKDKLPDDEDLVITGCWCTDYFKNLQQGWYCRECNEWYDTNGDKICVTHWNWMPILDLRNSINRAFKGGS